MTGALVFTGRARADLNEIIEYIAPDNPGRARTYVAEAQATCQNLCEAPFIGTDRSDLRVGLRLIVFRRRVVIGYDLPAGRVRVVRIFSAGRDYEALLAPRRLQPS